MLRFMDNLKSESFHFSKDREKYGTVKICRLSATDENIPMQSTNPNRQLIAELKKKR